MGDREQILRRRALFLSSTMVALAGCERPGSGAPPQTSAVVVPEAHGAAPSSSRALPSPPGLPPPDAPPSLQPPAEAEKYADMARSTVQLLETLAEQIAQLDRGLPTDCRGGCKAQLEPLAQRLRAFEEQLDSLRSLCPASSPEGEALESWQEEHRAYYLRRAARLDRAARELARRFEGDAGEAAWAALRRNDLRAMVCLSCMQW
jgi:hypothetical protein